MKVNQLLAIGGIAAALLLSSGTVFAQNDNGGGGGGFGGGRRNFDPAQMQQRMMDNIRDQLGFTNDTDWSAVQPLIQKVMETRRQVGGGPGMARMFRNRNNGEQGGNNRRGGFFGQPSPEAEALQSAIDNNAPAAQIKDLLAKYEASQKTKRTALAQAQEDLRKVLTTKQEAQATLLGLLD